MTTVTRLHFTGNDEADEFLAEDPLALMVGFVLDQQVPLQKAFSSPLELKRRLGGKFDAETIAGMDPGELDQIFSQKPALHRFPGTMAKRTQEFARAVVSELDGDVTRIWTDASDGQDLYKRLLDLPGIGEMKARTLVAVLGKRFGVQPPGWEDVLPKHPTLGDVDSAESLRGYQEHKRAMKAAHRAKQGG
jgi:uncharacterized HhH-GPD family protein